MDITISHPDFKTQLLELSVSRLFRGPRILINGVVVKRIDGVYTVFNDAGHEVVIEVNANLFYRLPQVLIELQSVPVTGKAGWRQFAGWENTAIARRTAVTLKMTKRLAVKSIASAMSVTKLNKSV
jgi:uncharacterized protein YdeI (BOF family)